MVNPEIFSFFDKTRTVNFSLDSRSTCEPGQRRGRLSTVIGESRFFLFFVHVQISAVISLQRRPTFEMSECYGYYEMSECYGRDAEEIEVLSITDLALADKLESEDIVETSLPSCTSPDTTSISDSVLMEGHSSSLPAHNTNGRGSMSVLTPLGTNILPVLLRLVLAVFWEPLYEIGPAHFFSFCSMVNPETLLSTIGQVR
jgi:hypothetical protein